MSHSVKKNETSRIFSNTVNQLVNNNSECAKKMINSNDDRIINDDNSGKVNVCGFRKQIIFNYTPLE